MITIDKVYQEWVDKIDHPIIAVETGCAFMWNEQCMHNLSTLHIVEQLIKPAGGKLYSLEINPERVAVCKMELEKRGLDQYVEFMIGESIDSLVKLKQRHVRVNFVWLDSLEDAQHARNEHNAVHSILHEKYILCVDDYGSANSVKWQDASTYIMENFDEYKTYDTPTGLIVGFNKGNK